MWRPVAGADAVCVVLVDQADKAESMAKAKFASRAQANSDTKVSRAQARADAVSIAPFRPCPASAP